MTKTYLAIPREEARKLIEAQTAKGREMFRRKIRSRTEFETLENAYDRWTDYNVQLCHELFTDDSIANEVHWHKAQLLEDRTLKDDVKHLQARIRDQLNKLISINERIGIIAVELPKAPRAETKNAHEKGVKELIKSNRHWIFEGIGTQTVQWIGSGILLLGVFIGGYIWTKKPANTSQVGPSPSPTAMHDVVNAPMPNLSHGTSPTPQISPGLNPDQSQYDPNRIVSSVDPALWPQLVGTWQQNHRNQQTGQFEPTPFKVQFYSEGDVLKCKLLLPPNPNLPEKTCTKLVVDGSRIMFSFGGSDYTGTLDLKRQFMDGKIISYRDNEYRGDWALTR